MTLEEYIAKLNGLAFWSEFTFDQNKFSPKAGQELELADSLVWMGRHAIALQLKERTAETSDSEIEKNWFEKKVIGKATRQIRDTLRYLDEHEKITVKNQRGHSFEIAKAQISQIIKIVVFLGGRSLPEACWRTGYHISGSAGFIHIVAAHDYLGILEKLRVPEDIRRYFAYREAVLTKLATSSAWVGEADIMGAFISDQDLPNADSHNALRNFLQGTEQFDLSPLLSNLHNQIQRSQKPYDYYLIMLEFARLPRSMWREIKLRLTKSLDAINDVRFSRPYRVAFRDTDCAFMIAPIPPEIPATGLEGEQFRVRGLQNLTDAAMYDTKVSKGVGLLISKDGEYFQLDWSFIELRWEYNSEMAHQLAENSPFREATEKELPSFLFKPE